MTKPVRAERSENNSISKVSIFYLRKPFNYVRLPPVCFV